MDGQGKLNANFGEKRPLNSCVHYFSIKSRVHICHAPDKNIETITVGFTGLKKLHYISQWSKYPLERSHDVISGQLPVLSDVENLAFKNFYCTKIYAWGSL